MEVCRVSNIVNPYQGNYRVSNIGNCSTAPVFRAGQTENVDTFNKTDKNTINIEKLNRLFPDGGIEKVYNQINQDFAIDNIPTLKLVGDDDGVVAGGYTFSKNEISLSLSDLAESDTKIVGIKDGKRTVLTSPENGLPLFVNSKLAQFSAYLLSKQGNLGYDKLVVEPITPDEHRKFVVQKISHEVIHAQQHMIMRQTEDIGEKEVLKAWTHVKPSNLIESAILNYRTNKMYNHSYWADKSETKRDINPESEKGRLAHEWLEAIRNYPKLDSPEYNKNAIEVDAYKRSANYVIEKYGKY